MKEMGNWGTINPVEDKIYFREDPLRRAKIEACKPFDRAKSNAEQPIRVVLAGDAKFIMQGNHRIMAAVELQMKSVEVICYTPDQWESMTECPFVAGGSNNPRILP